jgi:hypothetical protein
MRRGDRSFLASPPRCAVVERDETLVDAQRLRRLIHVVPTQREHLAPPQAEQHAEAERDRPPMAAGDLEEAVDL